MNKGILVASAAVVLAVFGAAANDVFYNRPSAPQKQVAKAPSAAEACNDTQYIEARGKKTPVISLACFQSVNGGPK